MKKEYKEIEKKLRSAVEDLKDMRKVFFDLQDMASSIEFEVNRLDAMLPGADEFGKLKTASEKTQVQRLYDLADEAFCLIDDILGAPQDAVTGETEGTVFTPEAKGLSNLSVEEFLKTVKPSTKAS